MYRKNENIVSTLTAQVLSEIAEQVSVIALAKDASGLSPAMAPHCFPVHPVHKTQKLVLLGGQGGNSGKGRN